MIVGPPSGARPRLSPQPLRQFALFVMVSGLGWLLDVAVLMLLGGPGGWPIWAANVASGTCGALLVFAAAASGIFRRNDGSMVQKAAVLLAFNVPVIVISSAVIGQVLAGLSLAAGAAGWSVAPGLLRLAAKVVVTPFTLLLNFVVVRFIVERFEGLRLAAASPR